MYGELQSYEQGGQLRSLRVSAMGGGLVSYDRPVISDRHINAYLGRGIVVVKSQIDFNFGEGKQFEWIAYEVDGTDVTRVDSVNAYEDQIERGVKSGGLSARDYFMGKE